MILLAYLLMYFVTAFIMIRHDWFIHSEPEISTQKIPFQQKSATTDPDILLEKIKSQLDITGREDKPIHKKDSSLIFNIYRPGLAYNIVLNKNRDSLTVKKTEQMSVPRVSSRLHLMRGYTGGPKYILWAFIYDIVSIAMVIFAVTGILIWIKMGKAYRKGIYYLIPGVIVSLGVLIYLMYF